MPSTSKEKQPTRNWLDLPSDIMCNILYRIGVTDILQNAQKVCTTWRTICKDPSIWRVIYMDYYNSPSACYRLQNMCKNVVDRSQGQLVDITIVGFVDDDLLLYLARRYDIMLIVIDTFLHLLYNSATQRFSVLLLCPLHGAMFICVRVIKYGKMGH